MNVMKKSLALLLVVVLALSCLPLGAVTAFAAENEETQPPMWEYNNKPEWYTPISLTDKARIADTVMDYAEMYVGQSMTGQGMSM